MNLAQVIDFDYEKRTYRIVPEKGYQPNRPARTAATPLVVREHHAPKSDDRPAESGVRRALRQAGREVMSVLQKSTERLTFGQLAKALPHVAATTLQVRLSNMVSRGDVVREGEFRDYRYGASTAST